MGFKRNDQVQQKLPAPFAGTVAGFSADQESGEMLVHVIADNGDSRYFKSTDLELPPTITDNGKAKK